VAHKGSAADYKCRWPWNYAPQTGGKF